ncbi:MAG: dihydrolipoyl dehydrogenase family protein [Spirochaetaceae bacterium]
MKYTHDILVIGGGSGGLSVASGCGQLGMKTALIEREHMGGDCLHFGCVPSKALLHAAERFSGYRDARSFASDTVPDINADIGKVNAFIASVIQSIMYHDSPERFRSLGVDVHLRTGRFRSPHEVSIGETVLSAPKIVISTGSRAAVPPVPGLADTPFLTNRDVFSLRSLPESMTVLGGGPIGIELSQAFAHLGCSVTIVEMAPRILPRDDEELASIIAHRLASDGITVLTGTKASSVAYDARNGFVVGIEGDGQTRSIQSEALLVAAGRQANTDDLGLEAAGIEAGPGGFIAVDSRLRTRQKHIYAIGDVNGSFPFTHVAGAEAAVVVRRVALHAGGTIDYRTVPWVTYTDPELAAVGYTEAAAEAENIPHTVVRQSFRSVDRAQAEEAADGLLKIVLDKRDRVIGVQVAAKGAGELLSPGLTAVRRRARFASLRSGMIPYPTMTEVYPRAVSSMLAPKLFNPTIRSILRLLFRYRGTGPVPQGDNQ